MGNAFLHGNGGGTYLNFKVKTYPSETELKEDKPSENTIGVITTTTMRSWVFSATESKEPEVGMVWISVGNASAVEFNALKKNTLQVYPLSVKQYEGGKWESKTAYSYIGGEWVTWWNGELYTPGNEWESFTGGWVSEAWQKVNDDGSKLTGVVMTKQAGADSLVFSHSFSNGQSSRVRHSKNIDMSEHDTVSIDFACTTTNGMDLFVKIKNESGSEVTSSHPMSGGAAYDSTLTLDISSFNGKGFVEIEPSTWGKPSDVTITLRDVKMSKN